MDSSVSAETGVTYIHPKASQAVKRNPLVMDRIKFIAVMMMVVETSSRLRLQIKNRRALRPACLIQTIKGLFSGRTNLIVADLQTATVIDVRCTDTKHRRAERHRGLSIRLDRAIRCSSVAQ